MSIKGVNIQKRNGGLGRKAPTKDMYCGMVLQGVAPVGGTLAYALGDVVQLNNIEDLEAYGIDADYDDTNSVLVHYHVSEFFRINPDGVLFLMVVAQAVTLTQMCDKSLAYVQKLITSEIAGGEIRCVAVGLNPDNLYAPTLLDGLDDDVLAAVPKAQELSAASFVNHYPVDVLLIEGREFNGTAAAAKDLRSMNAENVGVVTAADPAISALKTEYETHAAIGTALGMVSLRKVDESIGEVGEPNQPAVNGNISSVDKYAGESRFAQAGLSSNLLTSSYSDDDLKTLVDKGFIIALKYKNYDGIYFYDGPTCTLITSDFAYIEANRTINKAARLLYKALMPKLKRKILLNADGTIQEQERQGLQSVGVKGLTSMLQASEISSADVYIDPAQDLLSDPELSINFSITPTAIAREIVASIGFQNPNL